MRRSPSVVDFRIYLISDRRGFEGEGKKSPVEEALKAGVKSVQLRDKGVPAEGLYRLALEMRQMTDRFGAKLFINDRVDVAVASRADGVHLTERSIPVSAVRKNWGKLIVGKSTHSIEGALDAGKEGADFITFGPVYYTPSKKKYGKPLGTTILNQVVTLLHIPVFAIGGIKPGNVSILYEEAKPYGIALISGIINSKDPQSAARQYLINLEGR